MSWDRRTVAVALPGQGLAPQVNALLTQQRKTWSVLRAGEAGLDQLRTRRLVESSSWVTVQDNPARVMSSTAKVDAGSVARRPCFLCEGNLPEAERAIAFGDDFLIVPNPYPILRDHLSIPSREHLAQELEPHIATLLQLTMAFGDGYLVLYNGPRCGASAPDHLHFQAGRAAGVPVLEQLERFTPGAGVTPVEDFGRRFMVVRAATAASCGRLLGAVLARLREVMSEEREPMVNVVATAWRGHPTVCLFPRGAHRPRCFFKDEEQGRVQISPGALDMVGLLVVTQPHHFDRVDAPLVRRVFEEVTMDAFRFDRLVEVCR